MRLFKKNSFSARQKAQHCHYERKSATVLWREMITVYSENGTKHTYCVVTLYQVVYIVTTVL